MTYDLFQHERTYHEHRRAMTLVELLVSLVLVSGVLLGAMSWLRVAAVSKQTLEQRMNREQSIEACFLRLMEVFESTEVDPTRKGIVRVTVEFSTVTIRSRSLAKGGPATAVLSHDAIKQQLSLSFSDRNRSASTVVLLEHVVEAEFEPLYASDERTSDDPVVAVRMTCVFSDGTRVTRRLEIT